MTSPEPAPGGPACAPAPDGLVWIDGDLTTFDAAVVPLEDRGFMFADGVYEVLRAYDGRLFEVPMHLERLAGSASGIELTLPEPLAAYGERAVWLLAQSGLSDAEIYIQITRGAARRNHLFPANVAPRQVMWARPMRKLAPSLWEQGAAAIGLPDERWARCHLKTISLLPNVLAKEAAHRAGALEALLVRDGRLTEGSASNAFLVAGGRLITPVADRRILDGVTRRVVLQLAHEAGLVVEEREVPWIEVTLAEEIFVTSTTMELMPITRLDGQPVGAGVPGPVYRQLAAAFKARSLRGV